ncbi:YbbC/YhhH family protein [Hymenobacter sp. DH14]|uniref:YbbC/YhhH family protein n=1 Tax=Hymenobacter cyanobacteriorum TaxID=2926463 RepID=A0A9X2AFP8_9BACT|nr:YbbC/YhhH family protein [Hymenobacter cyanobacteriorum]MCI1188077.1 YbbC/YhhH family protein [Hymenobacter cyanobacteriorum]
MKQLVSLSLIMGLLMVASSAKAQTPKARPQEPTASPSFMPSGGFVPDAATAKRIAEVVWLPIYGKKVLSEKPYQATLNSKGVWVVEGSLPKDMDGGVAYIEISKRDGRILEVTHGK